MRKSSSFIFILTCLLVLGSCKKDNVDTVILQSTVYQLTATTDDNITGTATFTEESDGSTHILIELTSSDTSENPAFIRFNTAEEGGTVAITLKDCTCLISDTVVTQLDGGTSINYDGLLKLDGHISIHESEDNLETVVAVANIGINNN